MTEGPIIRQATERDIAAVVEISRTTPWDKERYLRRQVDQGDLFVAVDKNAAVGFVVWNHEFFSLPFIWLVVVSPAHRKKRIATALLDFVEARCEGKRIFSSTNLSNDAMRRILERRGYRRAGEVDVDPGDPEIFYQLGSS